MMRSLVLVLLLGLGAADIARADSPSLPSGLALGIEVGEPSSATVRWAGANGRLGTSVSLGTGTLAGIGVALGLDTTYAVAVLHRGDRLRVPLHLGLGARHYRHGYDPASIDEVDDAHTGVVAVVAVGAVLSSRIEIYVQGAPGIDLHRTASCTFMSSVDSLCPHSQTSSAFVQVVAGMRWHMGTR